MTVRRIAYTPGEPAGVGPDLILQLASPPEEAELVLFADPDLLRQRAERLGLALEVVPFDPTAPPQPSRPGRVVVQAIPLAVPATPGRLDPRNADYVLETLRQATRSVLEGECHALVTGPVHKGNISEAGHPFTGHTEFLADLTGGDPVMMLATEGLRVALVTTHLPLREVADAITKERLERTLRTLHQELRCRLGVAQPRILVAGLNPHAGEGGHLGREELEIIDPLLERLRSEGLDLVGALPADTLFTPPLLEGADAVLAMYHDQGLTVLKHKGFGRAVNITLGLPMIRTSVDHGTALDLAGSGRASTGSLAYALSVAMTMRG